MYPKTCLLSIYLFACPLFSTPQVETVVGDGTAATIDGPTETARVDNPFGVVRGPDGALWFCEYGGHTVRRITEDGVVETIVGNGTAGYSGDGGPAIQAQLNQPHEIRFGPMNRLYIADKNNHAIRRVDLEKDEIVTIAGNGQAGFSGDGGKPELSIFNKPHSIQFSQNGDLYIADIGNHRLRVIRAKTNRIETIAGNGSRDDTPDGGPFANAPLNGPRTLDFDKNGDLWLALREGNQIYRLNMDRGTIHHIAGTGEKGFTGNGGDPKLAKLAGPKGIAVAPNGDIYFADTESHTIRMIDVSDNKLRVVVGNGENADGPDGPALSCSLARPHGIFIDAEGMLYIGDSENHRIRRMSLND